MTSQKALHPTYPHYGERPDRVLIAITAALFVVDASNLSRLSGIAPLY